MLRVTALVTKLNAKILALVFLYRELVKSYYFWLSGVVERVDLEDHELATQLPAFEVIRNQSKSRITFLGILCITRSRENIFNWFSTV